MQFGAGINASDTRFEIQGADLRIDYGTQGDSIILKNYIRNFADTGQYSFNEIDYSDGTSSTNYNYGTNYFAAINTYESNGYWLDSTGFEKDGSGATDAKQAFSAIVNGLAQIEALESAVESSKSAVQGNQIGYRLGIHINIDVLNAEQQLYTAQRDLVKARYDTLFQGLKLKAAAGTLTETDVLVVNGLLAN